MLKIMMNLKFLSIINNFDFFIYVPILIVKKNIF